MEVSLHVLVWNDRKDLPELLRSLRALTYPHLQIRILDNGSVDDSLAYLREHASDWVVACNSRNVGFAEGHNQLMRFALRRWEGQDLSQRAILAVNADMILDPAFIEHLLLPFERPEVGATQPKIYRAFRSSDEQGGAVLSHVIDTTGLVMRKNWRMEDRGAGLEDQGFFDAQNDLIGPAGALPCYRASALRDIVEDESFFDEDFFAYREDCDLAFRLQRRGWKTEFCPLAHAWHFRGMYGSEKRSLLQRWQDRKKQSRFSAAYSTRNQLFFLIKNFTWKAWSMFPRVLFHEGGRVVYGLCFEPETRKILLQALTTFPRMLKKRRQLQQKDCVSWNDLSSYVSD